MRIALQKLKLFMTFACGVLLLAGTLVADNPRRILAADDSKDVIAIVDDTGKVFWQHPIRNIHDLHHLPNGNLLFQTTWTRLVEMTPDKEIVWEYEAAQANREDGKKVEIHAFERLDNGWTLIAESGAARIIEVDRKGRIQHEIPLQVDTPSTHSDTRMVRLTSAGTYLVCHERDGHVREYDRNGKIVWEYEVPLFGKSRKRGHGPEGFGNAVYGAIRLSNGNTLISTGNGHSVIEVTPGKKIVWSLRQNDLPGITLAWVTTLTVLPNGNLVIGNCHAGPKNPQLVEVTRDKEVVWSFRNFDIFGNALPCSQLLDAPAGTLR